MNQQAQSMFESINAMNEFNQSMAQLEKQVTEHIVKSTGIPKEELMKMRLGDIKLRTVKNR